MKKATLLLAPLLIIMGLHAKPSDIITENDHIKTGTTIGHYAKPGAPIDMSYRSSPVKSNETSEINITLTTSAQTGIMHVQLSFDENLTQVSSVDENLDFQITPQQATYPINLQVSSLEDGLYYIRLLTQVDQGSAAQLRAFAVPVYIGENPQPKTRSNKIMKAMSGENISVSKAIETISQ